MRAVHPADANRATAAPYPPSRKARKNLSRAAPMANFLKKIIWSKRRRSVFFGLTVIVFLIDAALVVFYTSFLWPHTLPGRYQSSFLGWNLLYNTQGPGKMSGDMEWFEKLWRSWWFYVQLGYSAYILSFRLTAIKNHEKDVGTCTRKDWKNLILKLVRAALVGSVVLIYFLDVTDLENPTIRNDTFFNVCHLEPEPGTRPFTISGNSWDGCGGGLLDNVRDVESRFVGSIPDLGPEGAFFNNGSMLMAMPPVGEQEDCLLQNAVLPPPMTLSTRPPRSCAAATYDFSNWATLHSTCSALEFGRHYQPLRLPDDHNYVEQWFCNITAASNLTHLTVRYDTAFSRAPLSRIGSCTLLGDHPVLLGQTGGPELQSNTSLFGTLSNFTDSQLLSVSNNIFYEEFRQCTGIEVACVENLRIPAVSGGPRNYHRTIGLTGCSRTFERSPTADVDQARWDKWLDDWKQGYRAAVAGNVLESVWDLVEVLANIII